MRSGSWKTHKEKRRSPIARIGALYMLRSLQTNVFLSLPSCPGASMVSRCLYQKALIASSERPCP